MPKTEPIDPTLYPRLFASWARLLPYCSLLMRLTLGLTLFSAGFTAVATPNPGFYRNAYSMGGPAMFATGLGHPALVQGIGYLELAVGFGLILGIFTSICAIVGAVVATLPLILTTIGTLLAFSAGAGLPGGGNPMFESSMLGILAVASSIPMIVMILLSPVSINKISFDALIFARTRRPLAPPAATPGPIGESVEALD